MAKRPRGTCRVCGRPWRARWQGDSLIVLRHSNSASECAGSGLPDAGEPIAQQSTMQPPTIQQPAPAQSLPQQGGKSLISWARAS